MKFKLLTLSLLFFMAMMPSLNAEVTYIHTDALGSVVAESDASGNVVQRYHYAPYGKALEQRQDDSPGFTGHVHDDDLGLTYMKARYYDPEIGRFYSNDPAGFSTDNPFSFNRYVYANNNPYKFVDPDGKAPKFFPWSRAEIGAGKAGLVPGTRTWVTSNGAIDPVKSFQYSGSNVTFSSNLKTKKMEIKVGNETYIEAPKATRRAGAKEFNNVPKRDQDAIIDDLTGGVKPITPKQGVEVYNKPDGTRTTVRTESTSNPGNINIDIMPKEGRKIEIKFKD